ncbi:hypothetical protein [Mycolicibacterium sp. YH-1]|uniref:hypothetical protein n=1 Tax=Mycolicibacterium sp. YH-1 TaxID=2908837 RepID=UPI001F4C286C|nr:hypothetical protein [Mycolicibacterium sp. YH-1]UNB54467.1 hypothetical protein L0M16_09150 [Mycolicibacterium sp. YH-1]
MDAGWFALGGSLITGVPASGAVIAQTLGARAQREHDAGEAKAQREADAAEQTASRDAEAAENLAQRQYEAEQRRLQLAVEQLERRGVTVNEWREALRNANSSWAAWDFKQAQDIFKPRVIGELWFEELRPHLDPRNHLLRRCIGHSRWRSGALSANGKRKPSAPNA